MPFAGTVVRMPRTGVPCLQIRRALLLRSEALVARAEAAELPEAGRLAAAAVADMVQAARERLAGLESWTVRGDASMAPGGLVVESDDGMADIRMETRRAVIEEVLAHLTLPAEKSGSGPVGNDA